MGKSKQGKSTKLKDANSGDAVASANGSNTKGSPSLGKRDIGKKSSSGCCVKLIFFLLLSVFCVVATVIFVDYKPGQLKEAYANIPPDVRKNIEKGAAVVARTYFTVESHARQQLQELKLVIRTMVKDLEISGVNIEHLLFAGDIGN